MVPIPKSPQTGGSTLEFGNEYLHHESTKKSKKAIAGKVSTVVTLGEDSGLEMERDSVGSDALAVFSPGWWCPLSVNSPNCTFVLRIFHHECHRHNKKRYRSRDNKNPDAGPHPRAMKQKVRGGCGVCVFRTPAPKVKLRQPEG